MKEILSLGVIYQGFSRWVGFVSTEYTNAIYPRKGRNVTYPALGLCGESGEVAEKVKKAIRDDRGKITSERREEIIKESGDVMWYLAAIASELKMSLEDIAKANIKKLASRVSRGKLRGSGDNR